MKARPNRPSILHQFTSTSLFHACSHSCSGGICSCQGNKHAAMCSSCKNQEGKTIRCMPVQEPHAHAMYIKDQPNPKSPAQFSTQREQFGNQPSHGQTARKCINVKNKQTKYHLSRDVSTSTRFFWLTTFLQAFQTTYRRSISRNLFNAHEIPGKQFFLPFSLSYKTMKRFPKPVRDSWREHRVSGYTAICPW